MANPPRKRRSPRAPGEDPAWMRIERRMDGRRGATKPVTPEEPITLPVPWFKALVGVFLLPFCWIATVALLEVFSETAGGKLWQSEEVWMFSAGFLLWFLAFLFLPRPTGIYVVGHELTHAFFVLACGGRIGRIRVTNEGGYILTDRNNFLISLSPYVIPFWSIISFAILFLARLALDIPWFERVLYFSLGVTWAFHATFTLDMIRKGQPDIEQNGRFFSLTLIYLCNVLLVSAMLGMASPRVGLADFARVAAREVTALGRSAAEVFR